MRECTASPEKPFQSPDQCSRSASEKAKNGMISLMWDIKPKRRDTDDPVVVTKRNGGEAVKCKGGQGMVMGDDLTLGGGHTMQIMYQGKSTLEY